MLMNYVTLPLSIREHEKTTVTVRTICLELSHENGTDRSRTLYQLLLTTLLPVPQHIKNVFAICILGT